MTIRTDKEALIALADNLESWADALLGQADRIWGWRKRDKTISIAIGDTSRAFRVVAAALRTQSSLEGDRQ